MSCYLRHLPELFVTLGLEYEKANRKRVDLAIRHVLGLSDRDGCPEVWSAVKSLSPEERADLAARVAEHLG